MPKADRTSKKPQPETERSSAAPSELPVFQPARAYTQDLAAWATNLRFSDLDDALIEKATFSVQDCLALCLYVGQKTDCGRSIARYALAESGKPQATVIGYGKEATAELAALANGTFALGLEFEDVHIGSGSHPYATVVPAALAMAERLGSDGRELLTAVVAGHEIACRVGTASGCKARDGQYMTWSRGLYTQQVFNVFGAAAAAAMLLKLDAGDTAMALGIAGEQAAGTQQSHGEGVYSRRLHGGLAAANGVRAALLVASGITGPKEFLEGRYGLYQALDLQFDADQLTRDLGSNWEFLDTWYKNYPSYTISHGPIQALLELRRKHSIDPANVERVVGYQAQWTQWHLRKDFPTQVVAQYGPRFLLATALLRGKYGLEEIQEETLNDEEIQTFAREKVDIVLDERLTKLRDTTPPPRTWPGAVKIVLKDGRELYAEVLRPLGSPGNPMSKDQMRAKFMSLASGSGVLDNAQVNELYEKVQRLREGGKVTEVTALLKRSS